MSAKEQGLSGQTVRNRVLRGILWAGGVLALFGLLGFLAAPPLVKWILVKQLSEQLRREVRLDEVSINPYALSVTLGGLAVVDADGKRELLAFDELHVNLEAQSLLHGGIVLSEVRLARPRLNIVRLERSRINVSDLIESFFAKPAGEPTAFSVSNIRILEGTVTVEDRFVGQTHRFTDIGIGVPVISNLPAQVDIFVEPALTARLDGTPFAIDGKARPFGERREATLAIDVEGLALPSWLDYVPLDLGFELASGRLDAQLSLSLAQTAAGEADVSVAGRLAVREVDIRDGAGNALVKWSRLAVQLGASKLLARQLALDSVTLDGAEVDIVGKQDGALNLAVLLPKASAPAAPPAEPSSSPPFSFSLAEAKINGAVLRLTDESVKPAFTSRVDPLDISVRNLSNRPDQSAELACDLKTSVGESLKLEAKATLAPVAVSGRVEVAGLSPLPYKAYYRDLLRFELERGTLAAATVFRYAREEGGATHFELSEMAAELSDLRLRRTGEKDAFFRMASLAVKNGTVDFGKRRLRIGEVASRDGQLAMVRMKDGRLDLQQLLPPESEGQPAATSAAPWNVEVARFALEGWAVRLDDHTLADPVTLTADKIQLAAENLAAGSQATFDLKSLIGKRGRIAAAGTLRPMPLALSVKLDAKDIDLLPLQPYFTERLNIELTRGEFSARGSVQVAGESGGSLRAAYRGELGLDDLHTVDKVNASDLLVWKRLRFTGIDAAYAPLKLDIAEIALTDFYTRLIIDPDGRLNLQQLVRRDEAAQAGAQPPAPATAKSTAGEGDAAAPAVRIGQITLEGGNVNFSDRFIKPNYSANMVGIGGRVSELSSRAGTTADVQIAGRLDGGAPLTIGGKINPLARDLFLDIQAKVRDIELAPLTPYAGKYAGYAIEKGKLSLDVSYKIADRKLEASNKLFLDQLTFGDRVESPDATKLPVLLAVALLKNSRGEIDIDLPIGGSLDDPDFSVGAIILKVILNLIVKAVTAPFALIGSLFGGGEELAYIEFPPGRAQFGAEEQKKLVSLAKALNDRPGLKLEIAGRIDPENDGEALKRVMLDHKVKAQKLAESVKKGEAQGSVEEVVLGKDEYARYLERAYKAASFEKPRNLVGLTKSLPVEEMEKLMLAHITVTDEDLRELANRRASSAKEWLLSEGKVPPERLFIVAPRMGHEESNPKARASRVDFSLK